MDAFYKRGEKSRMLIGGRRLFRKLARWLAHGPARLRKLIVPQPFPDIEEESEFLQDYRRAGLQAVAYACTLGVAAYVAIGTADILFSGWDAEAMARRVIAVSILALTVVLVVVKPNQALRSYSLWLGSLGALNIVGLMSVIHLFRLEDVSELVNPVSLFALWILYGFVRLPLQVAILVGSVGSFFSMFVSRLTNMPDPATRTFIYLLLANALGVLLARSIEVRERQLFLQRRMAETAQAELQRRTSYAEGASAEKTRLIVAIGHDLRQPMLSAVLHAEVLNQRLGSGDQVGVSSQAKRVVQSVKVMGETLDHLLTAARYDAGTEPVKLELISVSKVFQRLWALFEPQALQAGISLRFREPSKGVTALTDEQAVHRVLMNLVSNAIKFTPRRMSGVSGVVLRASLINGICRISVADNGIGIAEDQLDAIWEPFYQVDNRERNRSRGLGLGLYLVKQSLARLDGHSLSVRSCTGRGSRFILSMPGTVEAPLEVNPGEDYRDAPYKDAPYAGCPEELSGRHVLIIEDDQEAREAIETQLLEWGILCSSGFSVETAIEACSKTSLPVYRIIADFRLPVIDGAEAIRVVRNLLGYTAPAVLVTAEVEKERLLDILPLRTTFLQKPFDAAALLNSLRL